MKFNAKLLDPVQAGGCLVVGFFSESILSSTAKKIDENSKGYLTDILQKGDFSGECGQSLLLHNVPNIVAERVLLLGCGKK